MCLVSILAIFYGLSLLLIFFK